MNVYLTSTPEFSPDVLNEVALILGQTQGELEFISSNPMTVQQFNLSIGELNPIDAIESLSFDEFFGLCSTYRVIKEIPV